MKKLFILMAILLMPTLALAEDVKPTMSLSGSATVNAEPDESYISLSVDNKEDDPNTAILKNNESMNRLYETLKEHNVSKQNVKTTSFVFVKTYRQEKIDERGNTRTVFDGYRVVNSVKVTVCDCGEVLGKLITKLAQDGATTISDISFGSSKASEKLQEARVLAMKEALSKASAYASAGGFTLAGVASVTEGYGTPKAMYESARLQGADSSTPVSGGTLSYSASVSVSWYISGSGQGTWHNLPRNQPKDVLENEGLKDRIEKLQDAIENEGFRNER